MVVSDKRYIALVPFGIFLAIFILLHILYSSATIGQDNFPILAALVAIIASFFTFQKNESLNDRIAIFMEGSSQTIVMHMCYIFYLSTVFTAILEHMGGIKAAVNLSLMLIPSWCIIPGMFMVTSLFSITVGTSMGAIAAFMPIAVNIATHCSLHPSLMAATIVCGAMFGDNLSILSDTTIASVAITKSSMKDKLFLNTKIAIPAFIISFIILLYQNYFITDFMQIIPAKSIGYLDIIKVIPYLATFYIALIGFDILIVLIAGIILAIGIGISLHTLTFLEAINLIFDGFYSSKGMVNVFMLVLLLSGLSKIISHNGGIDYLIDQLEHKIPNALCAKLAIFLLITLINMTIAINTVAILITGPIANKMGNDYKIPAAQTACILDIGSCFTQGILPYAPQLLLAASIAQVSTISLLPYLYYQYFLVISLLVVMVYKKK